LNFSLKKPKATPRIKASAAEKPIVKRIVISISISSYFISPVKPINAIPIKDVAIKSIGVPCKNFGTGLVFIRSLMPARRIIAKR